MTFDPIGMCSKSMVVVLTCCPLMEWRYHTAAVLYFCATRKHQTQCKSMRDVAACLKLVNGAGKKCMSRMVAPLHEQLTNKLLHLLCALHLICLVQYPYVLQGSVLLLRCFVPEFAYCICRSCKSRHVISAHPISAHLWRPNDSVCQLQPCDPSKGHCQAV